MCIGKLQKTEARGYCVFYPGKVLVEQIQVGVSHRHCFHGAEVSETFTANIVMSHQEIQEDGVRNIGVW